MAPLAARILDLSLFRSLVSPARSQPPASGIADVEEADKGVADDDDDGGEGEMQ